MFEGGGNFEGVRNLEGERNLEGVRNLEGENRNEDHMGKMSKIVNNKWDKNEIPSRGNPPMGILHV